MDAKEFKRGDIEHLRDEAQNCAGAGVKWMTITERPEAIAELAKIALASLSDAAQATMPPLTDAMRAVLRNENCIYGTEDELYTALCEAVGTAAPQAGTLTEAAITEAVKQWFPDRAYQAPFFARALLAAHPTAQAEN